MTCPQMMVLQWSSACAVRAGTQAGDGRARAAGHGKAKRGAGGGGSGGPAALPCAGRQVRPARCGSSRVNMPCPCCCVCSWFRPTLWCAKRGMGGHHSLLTRACMPQPGAAGRARGGGGAAPAAALTHAAAGAAPGHRRARRRAQRPGRGALAALIHIAASAFVSADASGRSASGVQKCCAFCSVLHAVHTPLTRALSGTCLFGRQSL